MESGIYQIRNIINKEIYIGSSINLEKRKSVHFSLLRSGKHHSIKLQRAFNKYGKENFKFEILELIERLVEERDLDFEKRLCKEYEQSYLDKYGAQEFIYKQDYRFVELTYNTCPIAGSALGRVLENYTPWNKDRQHTDPHRENLKKAWIRRKENYPTKDSTKKQMSKSISETRQKPEVKEKYKQAILNRPLITCLHCGYESLNKGNMTKCHFDRCKENPNFDHEAEKVRRKELSLKLKEAKSNQPLVKCPHCPKESRNKGNLMKNHFDNCQLKKISLSL